jgi:hypothetical protein
MALNIMRAMRTLPAVLMAGAIIGSSANAQSISAEIDFSAGASSADVQAAATQVRVFGDAIASIQYYVEGAWGRRSGDHLTISDVFGTAYPYDDRAKLIEAYGERYFRPGSALLGIRAGRFRTPFGIYSRSDHAYTGFLRAPLIRYDGYFAVSNNYLEHGVQVTAGIPQLFIESSVGTPHDMGMAKRRDGIDTVVRVQGFHGPFIVGASYSNSNPYLPARFARGRAAFTGVDFRWTYAGVQLRGEWLTGHPFVGTNVSTDGWYVDGIVHRSGMGPVTAVLRIESMDYAAQPPRARHADRVVTGARVRLPGPVTLQLNFTHQTGDLERAKDNSLDFGATYSFRYR